MVSSRRDHASSGGNSIHLIASLGFISDENAHPNIDRGSGKGSKGKKDAIMFGTKPNKAILNAPTLPPWLSAAAWPRRGSKLAATKKDPKESARHARTGEETRIIPPEGQPATSKIQGNTTNPPWSIDDFQEVMLRGFEVEAGAVDGDCDVGLHHSSSPLFRWVIMSSRLLSGACTPKQPLPPLPLDQAPPPPSAREPDYNVELRASLPVSRPMRAARRKPMRLDVVGEAGRGDATLPSSSGAGDVASRSTLHAFGYRIPQTWLVKGGGGGGGQEEEGGRGSNGIRRRNWAGRGGQAGGATPPGGARTAAAAASSPDAAAELSTCSTVPRGEDEEDAGSSSSPHRGHLDAADLGFCARARMKTFMRIGGARGASSRSPSSSRSHCGAEDVGSWSAAENRKRVDLRGRYETSLESVHNAHRRASPGLEINHPWSPGLDVGMLGEEESSSSASSSEAATPEGSPEGTPRGGGVEEGEGHGVILARRILGIRARYSGYTQVVVEGGVERVCAATDWDC